MSEYDHADYDEARALQKEVGVIDMHVDCIIQQRLFRYNLMKRHRRGMRGQPWFWHADVPRMLEAGYGGAMMGIHYWPWESKRGWREAKAQIDYLDRVAEADERAIRVRHPDDWERAHAEGRIALIPGVEGTHILNGELSLVEEMARLGVAYLTITHFSKNRAATPSMGRGANEKDGLTDFGRDLIGALNRWGVAIDVAHVNTPGVLEICRLTKAPIFCTHTGVKGVKGHARNITDDEIDAIAALDGTIGVMFSTQFLGKGLRDTCEAAVDHIDYLVQRVGPRHVSIGSDFDGWIPMFSDMRDCLDLVKITAQLIDRGYSREDLALILRGNTLRVWRAVWDARQESFDG